MADVPYSFDRTAEAGHARTTATAPSGRGEESDEVVSVAGRVMLMRPRGELAFATLRDSSGQVQLFALQQITAEFEAFTKLSLGDWVGATGEVVRTRKGELSVQVQHWVLLAEARRGFGDKWKGVSDVETRYRQREVDLWANERTPRDPDLRSRLVSSVRRRLEASRVRRGRDAGAPRPSPAAPTPSPFVTHHNALDADLYLRIAPELYLKRLVVGGFEKVFEIGRVFRNEGLSPRHNPEFTMLELYQAYADYRDLAVLIEELVAGLALGAARHDDRSPTRAASSTSPRPGGGPPWPSS